MDAIECIMTRRSCRSFTAEAVSETEIETLLKCAMQSPTADNTQSWKFVVVQESEILNKIAGFHPYGGFLKHTPLGILICGDISISPDMWIQDASIAGQTILLAAHALGLGGCWLIVHPEPKIAKGFRDLLKIPGNIQPLGFLALGHPSKPPSQANRFDPNKVHKNIW